MGWRGEERDYRIKLTIEGGRKGREGGLMSELEEVCGVSK